VQNDGESRVLNCESDEGDEGEREAQEGCWRGRHGCYESPGRAEPTVRAREAEEQEREEGEGRRQSSTRLSRELHQSPGFTVDSSSVPPSPRLPSSGSRAVRGEGGTPLFLFSFFSLRR
jgi:hypothetical protein